VSAPPRPAIHPGAVYQLRVPADRLPAELRLRALEWAMLFALDGRHTVAQVAARLELSGPQAVSCLRGLLAAELVTERRLELGEYLEAVALSGDHEPRTFAQLLTTAPLRPGRAHAPGSTPAMPSTAADAAPVPRPARPRGAPPAFRPLIQEETPMRPENALSLQAVMRFIRGRAGDETAGQLAVYRAFLRVDPALLQRHGITTLRFEEDRVVRDPELVGRIVESVESTLGVRCPPDVFV
jgi:hypothetical protein